MPASFACPNPNCRRTVLVADDLRGSAIRCPQYQTAFRTPPLMAKPVTVSDPAISSSLAPTLSAPPARPNETLAAPDATPAVTPTLTPAATPTRINRFEVRRRLGAGAFGVVYQAYDAPLDREVALKVAKPEALCTEQRVKRFLREAKAAANLRHPNIVPVFDSGRDGEQYFIASAFIAGHSLEAELDQRGPDGEDDPRRPLEMREATRLIQRLAEALAYAHKKGVIHRDVKPANVLLDEQREPLLADFGLAARPEGEEKLTQEATIMGTPAYMAPEQGQGNAEAASDQYSLGCTLYELLTGRTLFAGPPEIQLVLHQTQEPPSPRKLYPQLPRDLETICLKCLEKQSGRRYSDCQALADDLRRWLEGEPITARRLSLAERAWRWGRRNPALAALLLVSVLGVLGIVWKYREAEREAAKAEQASDYLASIFELADANGQRGTMTARQILDDAEKTIPQKFADQPELRDKLLRKIGTVYDKLTENAPLAMILEVRGKVEMQSERNGNKEAKPQTLLYAGDRLSLKADGHVQLVILSDLHKERLKPGREVMIRRKGCEPADAISERDDDVLMTFVRQPKGTFYMGWMVRTRGQRRRSKRTSRSPSMM